jgi:hypothetical protein
LDDDEDTEEDIEIVSKDEEKRTEWMHPGEDIMISEESEDDDNGYYLIQRREHMVSGRS